MQNLYGWKNRETYVANLYISNTENVWLVLRNTSAEHIKEVITGGVGLQPARDAIGDLSKVDWVELSNHLNDSNTIEVLT